MKTFMNRAVWMILWFIIMAPVSFGLLLVWAGVSIVLLPVSLTFTKFWMAAGLLAWFVFSLGFIAQWADDHTRRAFQWMEAKTSGWFSEQATV